MNDYSYLMNRSGYRSFIDTPRQGVRRRNPAEANSGRTIITEGESKMTSSMPLSLNPNTDMADSVRLATPPEQPSPAARITPQMLQPAPTPAPAAQTPTAARQPGTAAQVPQNNTARAPSTPSPAPPQGRTNGTPGGVGLFTPNVITPSHMSQAIDMLPPAEALPNIPLRSAPIASAEMSSALPNGMTAGSAPSQVRNAAQGTQAVQDLQTQMRQAGIPAQVNSIENAPDVATNLMYTPGYLRTQIGKTLQVESATGNELTSRVGTLMCVGADYLTLAMPGGMHTVCALAPIRFITVLQPVAPLT